MKNFWIVLVLVASFGVYTKAQAEDNYDDYFNYDEIEDFDKALEEVEKPVNEKTDIENDLKVEEEIKQFREADEAILDFIDKPRDNLDDIDGFQLEDNRFKLEEGENDETNVNYADADESFEAGANSEDNEENAKDNIENRPEPDDPNAPKRNEDYALLWGDDSVAPLPVPDVDEEDENKAVFDETRQILNEKDVDDFEDEIKKAFEQKDDTEPEKQPNNDQVFEETKKILDETDDSFDEKRDDKVDIGAVNDKKDQENMENKADEQEDTVDKAYEDLNADLDKLFDTLDRLKSDISDNNNDSKDVNNSDGMKQDVKYGNDDNDSKKEESNNDREDIDKASEEVEKLFADINLDNYNIEGSEDKIEDTKNDDVDLDKLLENILGEEDLKAEDSSAEVFEPLINDALNEPNPDDTDDKDVESLVSNLQNNNHDDDTLIDKVNDNAETLEQSDNRNDENAKDASVEKEIEVKTSLVDDLTSSELEDLVSQFAILHGDELDVNSENFNRDVAPVHITLKVDEPTIITSPNYPDRYPTNNIVDWVLEGPGLGIELNITDFAVNGALGDYLLIKSGGIDDADHEGLLFTYRLTSERRYRFTDVDRLFMRFESNPGTMEFTGFCISAKMIDSLSKEAEPIPEPEAVVPPPHSTATVTLAVRVPDFQNMRDGFRQLLADMAEQYINDNSVDPGLNSTSEVTHITHVGLCPVSWPNYEDCTAVTFAVTLEYEDEDLDPRLDDDDLKAMWTVYSKRDPFALRLRAMGIFEFYGPGSGVITRWLLITGAVVILMTVLAFVLWRYSCFEDYTRMKTYSDTTSLHNEKRGLDLYPTPHQNLPPLYAEHEYKWPEEDAIRVDMGGFSNHSYARNDMYDFDSDEDVIASRDRKGVVAAKDFGSNV